MARLQRIRYCGNSASSVRYRIKLRLSVIVDKFSVGFIVFLFVDNIMLMKMRDILSRARYLFGCQFLYLLINVDTDAGGI